MVDGSAGVSKYGYLLDENGRPFWKPSLKQEKFLSIPLSIKEAFYAGALMAGKSDVLLMYPIVHGWHKHPMFKGLFLRRTMPELRNEIIPRAKAYFRAFGGEYNAKDGLFTFPSGALFFMGHCENENDVHNYDSMQPNYVAFDELTSFTEWIYTYITVERCRVNKIYEKELPAIVRAASNPGNIGHRFVYERFIKPCPEGGKILRGRGGIKRLFIPATIDDNPHASEQYKRELDALPEAERKAKKYGDWQAYEGQVFSEFRDKKIEGEPDNAYHLIKPFDIPTFWPKVCAIDWGFNAMCSIGFGAIAPNKRVVVYRHLMFFGKKIEIWAAPVKYFIDKENIQDVVICHSASQNRGDPHTVQEQVQEALNVPVRLGEKDRVGGKTLLHEYLRWEKRDKAPLEAIAPYDHNLALWLFRNKGEQTYKEYMALYAAPEDDELNIPRLLFFDEPDVKVICETIKQCVYQKVATDGKKKEDVAEFSGDDPYDMLRMLLHSVDVFFGVADAELKKLEKIQEIQEMYNKTQDMTAFYRNMRVLESAEKIVPVKRFHHAPRRH